MKKKNEPRILEALKDHEIFLADLEGATFVELQNIEDDGYVDIKVHVPQVKKDFWWGVKFDFEVK